jgi:hypothetical protein
MLPFPAQEFITRLFGALKDTGQATNPLVG